MTQSVLEKAPAVEWTQDDIKMLVCIARHKFNEEKTQLEQRLSCAAATRQHDFLVSFAEQIKRNPTGFPWTWADAALAEVSVLIEARGMAEAAGNCPAARKVFLRVMNRALHEFYTRKRVPAQDICGLLVKM